MLSASSTVGHTFFSGQGDTAKMKNGQKPGTLDFLPSVSFDDLHASIESASTDFKLDQFPSPTGDGNILDRQMADKEKAHNTHARNTSATKGSIPTSSSRQGRTGSILRRPSTSSRQPSTSSIASTWSGTVDAPTAASTNASRARRQSHYPPVSNVATVKQPRKSIGPGVLADPTDVAATAAAVATRTTQRRRASIISDHAPGTDSVRASVDGTDSTRGLSSNSRTVKAKSVQPPPRSAQPGMIPGFSTVLASESSRLSLASRSPRLSSKTSTPSSASKRASMMPGSTHASGLGARTISPTDTRRMKRLSMMPQTQTLDQVLSVPMPVALPDGQSTGSGTSPLPPTKTSGPASGITTPEPNRRAPSSNNIGSTSNVRQSLGGTPRLPSSVSTPVMRLPSPKANGMHKPTNSSDEEDVPPVPAIPKAYESPKDVSLETYFVDKKKSIISTDSTSLKSTSSSTNLLTQTETPKVKRNTSIRKTSYVPTRAADNDLGQTKKQLVPLTLPPLNLGPLTIPTTVKSSLTRDDLSNSKPIRVPKTPTTPMTASKSTFFSQTRYDDIIQLPSLRSSSTVHQPAELDDTPDNSSSDSSSFKEPEKLSMSPFLSSSLPKGGFDHEGLKRSKTGGDLATITVPVFDEQEYKKPQGPRPPVQNIKIPKSPPPIPTTDEPSTPSSISSLRRRLSMSWKRSSSKSGPTSATEPTNGKAATQATNKYDGMPPPRIPISSTTNNLPSLKPRSPVSGSSSNNGLTNSSRRRKSSASSLNNLIATSTNDGWVGNKEKDAAETTSRLPEPKTVKPKTSAAPVYRAVPYTAELDKEDMAANEEMRKMGSRRKETDIAARTLDALRKRATPKERVGPQEAIRIAMLNIYERGEIIDYNDIYFCGTQSARKVIGNLQSDAPNFGYDDERGDYAIVPGDHLAYRYEIVDVLGKGSFGQVVRCIDHKHGVLVAVKIIRNKKRFHQQALVEVNILQKLREWVSFSLVCPPFETLLTTTVTGPQGQAQHGKLYAKLLLPWSSLHFDGTARHEPVRIYQGAFLPWLLPPHHPTIHKTDFEFADSA